jgi:iron complex transport system substrate-binding protein
MTGRKVRLIAILCAVALAGLLWLGYALRPASEAPGRTDPSGIRRVVSFSPALTEIIFALGQEGKLVGVSSFCTYPPAANELPVCGGLIDPNLELLAELNPDVVFLQGISPTLLDWCEKTGQGHEPVKLDTLDDIWTTTRRIGEVLGCPEEAEALAARIQGELNDVRARVAGRAPVPVFICLGREPGKIRGLMTAGRASFLTDLIAMAGGQNVFSDAAMLYPQPSLEALVERAPQVILDLQPEWTGSERAEADLVAQWSVLDTVPAVRNGRIEVLTDDYLLIPGPRVGALARRIATVLHPEAFGGE